MRTMEESWLELRKRLEKAGLGEYEIGLSRRMFYSGAISLMLKLEDKSVGEAEIAGIIGELKKFFRETIENGAAAEREADKPRKEF